MTDLIITKPGVYKVDGKTYRTILVDHDDVTIDGLPVRFTPDTNTVAWTPAVKAVGRSRLKFLNMKIVGGPAIKGVSKRAKPDADRPGNAVLGLPIGTAMDLERCTDVLVQGCEMMKFFDGIKISGGSNITIVDNNIHDLRTTPIHGSPAGQVEISRNHLHDSYPWMLGKADHGDFIHLWTATKNGPGPTARVVIRDNQLEQGKGAPIMGINLEDLGGAGFVDVLIDANRVATNNGQGIRVSNTVGSITDNDLTPVAGLDDPSNAPSIVPRNSHVAITGNICRMNTTMKPYAAQNTALTVAQLAAFAVAGSAPATIPAPR